MADPMKNMTSRGAQYWAQNMCYLVESHGLNYMKILCLQWQSTTGKACTKRAHQSDTYKRELECEAQLVECMTMAVQGGGNTCKSLAVVLHKIHDDMGCCCEWQPKLNPPKISNRQFLQAKIAHRFDWITRSVHVSVL